MYVLKVFFPRRQSGLNLCQMPSSIEYKCTAAVCLPLPRVLCRKYLKQIILWTESINYPVYGLSPQINLFEIFSTKHARQWQTNFSCTLNRFVYSRFKIHSLKPRLRLGHKLGILKRSATKLYLCAISSLYLQNCLSCDT